MRVRENVQDEAEDQEDAAILVFARIDDLPPDADRTGHLPPDAVAVLVHWGVKLILVSMGAAPQVRQVQCRLNITEPFVCEGGAALHIPPVCFQAEDSLLSLDEDWDVIRFSPPNRMAAVAVLRDLFVAHGYGDVLTIGIGCDLDDYGVLAAVDVPVVVRDPAKEQRQLLRYIPGAYMTTATGIEGWSEALIGP